MAKLKMTASVVSQAQLAEGIYDLRLKAPEIASQAAAGQFVSVYSQRRLPSASKTHQPLRNRQRGRTAASGIQSSRGRHRRVFCIEGRGYGRYPGPLGNGVFSSGREKAFLIGGGIGIPPMLQLAKELCALNGSEMVQSVIGYRDSQLF